jgi:hypothetical protein
MRKLHRTALSGASSALAGLALAAGAALSAAPAGAATTALMDFPTGSTQGTLVNANSGKCLEPSRDNLFGNGDIIEQHTCSTSPAQIWVLKPIGTMTFVSTTISGNPFQITHPGYRLQNLASGLCLDDRDGVTHNGAVVQLWACNTTSTTMKWGSFATADGRSLIANARASFSRAELMTLEVVSGSTEENVPVQLFNAPTPPPLAQEWVYDRTD